MQWKVTSIAAVKGEVQWGGMMLHHNEKYIKIYLVPTWPGAESVH